jgi:hypothetical protein
MSEQISLDQRYMISVYEPKEIGGAFVFCFGPTGLMHERGPGGPLKRVQKFVVSVRQGTEGLAFDWGTQDDPGAEREEMEAAIPLILKARAVWIARVTALVGQVEQWAKELGWSTRRVEKRLDDSWIGEHGVPALLMQEDTCRILLEPVGRSAPGTEGVVDLYLMPAYDEIAALYYYSDRWNLHYISPGTKPVTTVREAEAAPLSKLTFEQVLGELRKHAA